MEPGLEIRLFPTEITNFAVHPASTEAVERGRSRMPTLSEPFDAEFGPDGEKLVP